MANRDLPIRSPSQLRALRSRQLHQAPPRSEGRFVLYWMLRTHRLHASYALELARDRARELGKPLLIVETLHADDPHAADRHHHFAAQALLEHRDDLADKAVAYISYAETEPGVAADAIDELVAAAAAVVGDDHPCPPVPQHLARLARSGKRHGVPVSVVDDHGLLPLRLLEDPCPTAAVYRRYAHKHLVQALQSAPQAHPLARVDDLPRVPQQWLKDFRRRHAGPCGWLDDFARDPAAALAALPIDHDVPVVAARGGHGRGRRELREWIAEGLPRYGERSDPTAPAASGLSPYLRWGMLAPWEIAESVFSAEGDLDLGRVGRKQGARLGFWPLSEPAQSYLDELVTWRELGAHTCTLRPDDFQRFDSLPDWALATLGAHRDDEREETYSRAKLEGAESHDELWNAAQRQLLRDGHIHNYLRMLWGKRVLGWKSDPQDAYHDLIHLNNRWALDGCDPNSWSGVLWCFGRYDRPWQERPVYGKVRYMTSDSTRKKFDLGPYLECYGDAAD